MQPFSALSHMMSISRNTSSPIVVAGGLHPGHSAWGDVLPATLTVGKLSLAILAFYLLGWVGGNKNTKRDSAYLAGAVLLARRDLVVQVIPQSLPRSALSYVVGTLVVQIGTATLRLRLRQKPKHEKDSFQSSFLKPLFFPARTTHTRLFPSRHSFSYSYLLVGVPLSWSGTSGSVLSTSNSSNHGAWFSVNPDDYLARDKGAASLQDKLTEYLSSQGISADLYPYGYLVTAPCFLGFSFNPVSFWYLYDQSQCLAAMILEVNNTFDERRMYLMQREEGQLASSQSTFLSSWSKDFHVSPFNDRDGTYSLTAKPLFVRNENISLDNTVVLKDEDGKAKIVARIFSTQPGLDPQQWPSIAQWSFLARWWWVGFVTNLRILKEAWVLWMKKLQVYYRPEVLKSSIGRNETIEERELEPYFRAFLIELVSGQSSPIVINYTPAAGPERGKMSRLSSPNCSSPPNLWPSLDVHVLTPAFYGEIARTGSILDAFARFCFKATAGEAMLHVTDHIVLQSLLQRFESFHDKKVSTMSLWPPEQLLVTALREERMKSLIALGLKKMIGLTQRPARPSKFDLFVYQTQSRGRYEAYLHSVRLLLTIDRLALGFGWLLDLERLFVQSACFAQVYRSVKVMDIAPYSIDSLLRFALYSAGFHYLRTTGR